MPDWAARFEQLAQHARHPLLQRFYQAGVASGQTPLEQVELLAMDLETTGLNARSDSIVSIGLMPFTLKRIRCGEALYWVIKPSQLSNESVTFHRITHADVRHAPRLPDVMEDLLEAMTGRIMVVHYRAIERNFLDEAFRRHLGEGLQFPIIDTMQLEARQVRGHRSWLDRLLRRPPASIRLADSRLRYQLPPYHAHHALTDALATAELLQAQVATHYSPCIAVGQLWD
ncbi:3'-5' exonuclease [Pseudomonas sp. SWRI102]|uniref:3'-5' exonuclease n=1 Tax=Pseudomonas marvdashtae TaxID=2745500 RepID=A0A923FRH3_9PSED|nr:3'-5' exonuclease [Pseudomonas marvdashtae]MBV4552375.1 3'-5' exonuclease [Pseudomonas marvdashtae]